jgi:hypothetical protein
MKLNVLLARAEHTGAQFKMMIQTYAHTFTHKQEIFRGTKKTYTKAPGSDDFPNMSGNEKVQSSVDEYLQWFEDTADEFITHRFNIEATNASGPKAELIVGGQKFGSYSTCELMRLNDFLNSPELLKMYSILPVRSDTENWKETTDPEGIKKKLWETDIKKLPHNTTIKGWIILPDPNVEKLKAGSPYTPIKESSDTKVYLGEQTMQKFSGEWSHADRASLLRRLTMLKASVKEALVTANETPMVESELTAKKIFGYLHRGTI